MSATHGIISKQVGPGCPNLRSDVLALQQLLVAAGQNISGGCDGFWGQSTQSAVENFQKANMKYGVLVKHSVDPGDRLLFVAAWFAQIVFALPGKGGIAGIRTMHEAFKQNQIKYDRSWNRAVFGLSQFPGYAIQTTGGKFERGPVRMDCTTYVNLMLGIYQNGNLNSAPYDASCKLFGDVSNQHCARDRYKMPLVKRVSNNKQLNYFQNAEQILAAVKAQGSGLYVIELAVAGTGSVRHMALLFEGQTFESTHPERGGSGCIDESLEKFVSRRRGYEPIFYLFGPSCSCK